jgi:hypothetical protein
MAPYSPQSNIKNFSFTNGTIFFSIKHKNFSLSNGTIFFSIKHKNFFLPNYGAPFVPQKKNNKKKKKKKTPLPSSGQIWKLPIKFFFLTRTLLTIHCAGYFTFPWRFSYKILI